MPRSDITSRPYGGKLDWRICDELFTRRPSWRQQQAEEDRPLREAESAELLRYRWCTLEEHVRPPDLIPIRELRA